MDEIDHLCIRLSKMRSNILILLDIKGEIISRIRNLFFIGGSIKDIKEDLGEAHTYIRKLFC